jgi:chromosome segregation ATPase
MFGKRSKPPAPAQRPLDDASQTVPSGPDPRDATIERLGRELAAERDNLTTVREALDAATFKVEVLEKSYAKQLADVRERLATTEQTLAEKNKLLGALDGGHEEALRALGEVRAELKTLTAERDELRQTVAQGGLKESGRSNPRAPLAYRAEQASESGGTINELIKDAAWAQKTVTVAAGHCGAAVTEQDTPPPEDLLAPDLVFTKGRGDEDDER